jgi:hypothetical protein
MAILAMRIPEATDNKSIFYLQHNKHASPSYFLAFYHIWSRRKCATFVQNAIADDVAKLYATIE